MSSAPCVPCWTVKAAEHLECAWVLPPLLQPLCCFSTLTRCNSNALGVFPYTLICILCSSFRCEGNKTPTARCQLWEEVSHSWGLFSLMLNVTSFQGIFQTMFSCSCEVWWQLFRARGTDRAVGFSNTSNGNSARTEPSPNWLWHVLVTMAWSLSCGGRFLRPLSWWELPIWIQRVRRCLFSYAWVCILTENN